MPNEHEACEGILDAIVAIGSAIKEQRHYRAKADREIENRKNRTKLDFPVGSTVFNFCYDDGIQEFTVANEWLIKTKYDEARYPREHEILADTEDGAIHLAVLDWVKQTPEDNEADMKHFKDMAEEYQRHVNWSKKALAFYEELTNAK